MTDSFFAAPLIGTTVLLGCWAYAQAKTIRKLRDLIDTLHEANKRRLEDVCIPPASYGGRRG